MESYPIGKISFAAKVISASVANTSSFATLRVLTASFALDRPGPSGSSGSGAPISGAIGPRGATGPQGPKGYGIYLLSSSLLTCCSTFDSFGSWYGTTSGNSGDYDECGQEAIYGYQIGPLVYSPGTGTQLDIGDKVYSVPGCNQAFLLTEYTAINNGSGNYYVINTATGAVTSVGVCSS